MGNGKKEMLKGEARKLVPDSYQHEKPATRTNIKKPELHLPPRFLL